MAYGERYYGLFETSTGKSCRVSIQEDGYGGSAEQLVMDGDAPVTLKYNTNDRVRSLVAEVRIRNTFDDRFLFAKMVQEAYTKYKLVVTYDGEDEFTGFLLPTTYSQFIQYKDLVVIPFSSGIGNLRYMYPDILTDSGDDCRTMMEYLISVMDLLGYDYKIYVNSSLYEDDMSAGEKADNPLKATYINRWVFRRNDEKWDTALEILNKILGSINAYATIINNILYVERFADMYVSGNKTWWTYDSDSDTYSSTGESFSVISFDSLEIRPGFQFTTEPPMKLFKLYLKPCNYTNLINNDFSKLIACKPSLGDPQNKLYYWTYNDDYIYIIGNVSNTYIARGINYYKDTGVDLDDYGVNGWLNYNGEFTNKNDDIIINLSFKHQHSLRGTYSFEYKYKILIRKLGQGWAYSVDQDGTVQTNVNQYRTITHTNNNDYSTDEYFRTLQDTIDLSGQLDALGITGDAEFLFEIFPPKEITDLGGETYRDATYGDFVFSITSAVEENYKEVDLNNTAFAEKEENMYIFDAGYINYFNQPLRLYDGSTPGVFAHTESWSDNNWNSKTLQEHYILNKCNLYNSCVPKISVTSIDRTKKLRPIDLFSTTKLKDDLGNDMRFWVTEFAWNLKFHEYKLTLSQWLVNGGVS